MIYRISKLGAAAFTLAVSSAAFAAFDLPQSPAEIANECAQTQSGVNFGLSHFGKAIAKRKRTQYLGATIYSEVKCGAGIYTLNFADGMYCYLRADGIPTFDEPSCHY